VMLRPPIFAPWWGGEMPAVAWSIVQGAGFASPYLVPSGPTALVPPVYPVLLAGIFRVAGYTPLAGYLAIGLNVLLSSLTVLPLFSLGSTLFGRTSARAAVWAWALYPLLGYTDAQFVWGTSLLVLLVTTCLAMTVSFDETASRRRWAAYGAVAGLLVMTEPVALAVVVPAAGWLFARRVNRRWLLVAMLIAATPTAAWMARNYATFGQVVFVRSGLGLELSLGVRHNELVESRPASLPNRDPAELARYMSLGELRYIEERKVEALAWIGAHPGEYLQRVGMRVFAYWTGWRQTSRFYLGYGRAPTLKMFVFSLPALGALLCLGYMVRERHPAAWLLVAVVGLFPAIYYFTHTLPRYRLPLEPLLFCCTACIALRAVRGMARAAPPPDSGDGRAALGGPAHGRDAA
jgi:4-amino-4-deoxy-L-arabinose transferase-like glycosyltransferase